MARLCFPFMMTHGLDDKVVKNYIFLAKSLTGGICHQYSPGWKSRKISWNCSHQCYTKQLNQNIEFFLQITQG